MHRRTHGCRDRCTDGQTENIYSIFRDKLLLLGEHIQDGSDFVSPGRLKWGKHGKQVSDVFEKYSYPEYFELVNMHVHL